jgi:hypothetical protein
MKRWTPPPDAVYNAGKKKEHATKAIRALEAVQSDISDSVFSKSNMTSDAIEQMLPVLKSYRKSLDE